MVAQPLEFLICADAPVRVRFDDAQEVAAEFNAPNPWGRVHEHPDLALGVGYRCAVLVDAEEVAAVAGAFYTATWKAAYDAGELKGGMDAPRPPCPGPDVLRLCSEVPMPITTPLGHNTVFRLPTEIRYVGVFRPHPHGIVLEHRGARLVLHLDLGTSDLCNLHLDLDQRNMAFDF